MTKVRSIEIEAVENTPGAFVVIATTVEGRAFFHEGPRNAIFFTRKQAVRLADRVAEKGSIDINYWAPVSKTWDEIEAEWYGEWEREQVERGAYA